MIDLKLQNKLKYNICFTVTVNCAIIYSVINRICLSADLLLMKEDVRNSRWSVLAGCSCRFQTCYSSMARSADQRFVWVEDCLFAFYRQHFRLLLSALYHIAARQNHRQYILYRHKPTVEIPWGLSSVCTKSRVNI